MPPPSQHYDGVPFTSHCEHKGADLRIPVSRLSCASVSKLLNINTVSKASMDPHLQPTHLLGFLSGGRSFPQSLQRACVLRWL